MYWSENAMVVISNIAKPCANGSGLTYSKFPAVAPGFESTPPIVRIWLPPTALQESP